MLDILRAAGLRIIMNGRASEGQRASLMALGPKYTDAELARGLRMLANMLDKEEED